MRPAFRRPLRPSRRVLPALALLLAAASVAAQGSVHVVNPASGHSHQTLQSGIDAAADGDTVHVRDGLYGSAVIDGKGLFLVFDEGASVNVERLEVRNLPVGGTVSIVNLSSFFGETSDHRAMLTIADCAGTVLLQDAVVDWTGLSGVAAFSSIPPEPQVVVRDSAGVALVRSTLVGRLVDDYASQTAGQTSPALRVERSSVSLHACTLRGADGYDGFDAFTEFMPSTVGSAGVVVDDAVLLATGGSITGGQGGDGTTGFLVPCIPARRGGEGLVATGAPSTVRLVDTPVAGGPPGVYSGSPCGASPPAGDDISPLGTPVDVLPGPALPFASTAVARESDTLSATVTGAPGDAVWAIFGVEPAWGDLGASPGTLLVAQPFVGVRFIGLVPPSGALALSVGAPPVTGVDVVHAMIQPVLNGATLRLADGALTVVLDDVY